MVQPPLPQISHRPSFLLAFWKPFLSKFAGDASIPMAQAISFILKVSISLSLVLSSFHAIKCPLALQESCAQTVLVFFPEPTFFTLLRPLILSSYLDSEVWIWIHLCLFFLSLLSRLNIFYALETSFSVPPGCVAYPYIQSLALIIFSHG